MWSLFFASFISLKHNFQTVNVSYCCIFWNLIFFIQLLHSVDPNNLYYTRYFIQFFCCCSTMKTEIAGSSRQLLDLLLGARYGFFVTREGEKLLNLTTLSLNWQYCLTVLTCQHSHCRLTVNYDLLSLVPTCISISLKHG